MKLQALILAFGAVVGATAIAQAQPAAAPPDPLSDLQNDFGTFVGGAFHAEDPIVDAAGAPGSPGRAAGAALRTSLEVPGAVFAGIVKPFADADAAANPAPPAPMAPHRRHAHRRHVPAQG